MNKMKKSDTAFPAGYGKFPYIMIKIGFARYVQLPIHRIQKVDHSDLKGVFISDPNETDAVILKQHNLDALMQVREQHFDKYQIYFPMCLVQGPDEAVYVDEDGKITESNSIPSGGVLITGEEDIISMSGKHYIG